MTAKKKMIVYIFVCIIWNIFILKSVCSMVPGLSQYGVDDSSLINKIAWCILFDLFLGIASILLKRNSVFVKTIFSTRNILINLGKNDFKTRFVGSYLGIFWAFVNPIVTILLYWFVFQFAFHSVDVDGFPFVLWFSAGLVPWFFFSESVTNATNSLLEYSYLVKKVSFRIEILPMVKIMSSAFVHIVFLLFIILLATFMGYLPSFYLVQLVYYFICMVVFVAALTYATSAIIVFFRDLGQFINVFMQVFMWMTPIMWQQNILPQNLIWIFMLNPMYYVIVGYRDSILYHIGICQRLGYTLYFWFVVILLFKVGTTIFERLRPHFADVL